MTPASNDRRREALLAAKLRALARSRWGDEVDGAEPGPLAGGATLRAGSRVWVLAEDDPGRSLGGALGWALTVGAGELHVIAAAEEGLLARRAGWFRLSPAVWPVIGTALAAQPAAPAPLPDEPGLDPRAEAFRAVFERAGAEPVVEGGILRAEVRGLEVARVELGEEGPRLAVGVGKHDREAHRELGSGAGGEERLFEVVRAVAEFRHEGGVGHPAYHLAGERWLRSVVLRRPELAGAAHLEPAPAPVARDDLRQRAPAPAGGLDSEGRAVLVVCSVGVDPDLVPAAVDAWLRDGRRPRLVLLVPQGDDYPALRRVAADLTFPAEVRVAPSEWRSL